MSQFSINISTVSQDTKDLAKEYNKKVSVDLCKIEEQLGEILIEGNSELEYESSNANLKLLLQVKKKKKKKILAYEEAKWCLKIWALWLKEGDDNTNFFHNFYFPRKQANIVWEI
jgi:hypothetical protein